MSVVAGKLEGSRLDLGIFPMSTSLPLIPRVLNVMVHHPLLEPPTTSTPPPTYPPALSLTYANVAASFIQPGALSGTGEEHYGTAVCISLKWLAVDLSLLHSFLLPILPLSTIFSQI